MISIVQNGNTFECRVNNIPFNHILELEKNKKIYTKDGTSPISTTFKNNKEIETPGSKFQLNLNEANSVNTANLAKGQT